MTFRPSVFNNQRPILTPADLDNDPLAAEYIEYMRHRRYPLDFKLWKERREQASIDRVNLQKAIIEALQKSPYALKPWERKRLMK